MLVGLNNKDKPAFIPKALFTINGRSSDLPLYSCRLPEIFDYQWHSDKLQELTAAGTVPDFHRIPY